MVSQENGAYWPNAVVQSGAAVFVAALFGATALDPSTWPLHCAQSAIYATIIWLVWRSSPLGFGAASLLAILWNSANLFVTGFAREGLRALATAIRDGHMNGVAYVLVVVGVVGHFLMVAGTLCWLALHRPNRSGWLRFVAGAVGSFVALIVIFPLRHHKQPLPLDVPTIEAQDRAGVQRN